MKNLIHYFLFILALVFMSCERMSTDNEVGNLICGVANPINDLSWLNKEHKALIGGPDINGIVLYKFKEKFVVEIQGSIFNSTNQHQYYCDGQKLDLTNPIAFQDFKQNRIEIKMLYGTKIWK